MGSSIVATAAQWLMDSLSDISSAEGDASELEQYAARCIARAHSLLRGSVDLW